MPDKIDTLYNALKADGAVTKSREHFRSKMLASGAEGYKNRKQLYDALKADGAVSSPTYEDFAARLGLHAVKPATGKQILKSRPTMQIVDGKSVPAKQRNVQPAAKSGTNPLTQASQRYWQAQAELDKPVVQSADTKSYAPGELLQKPKSNRELIDAAKKQLRATRPQPQPQPWKFSEQAHSSNQNEPSLAGAIDSATEAVKRQHTSLTAQLKHNSPLPMTKDEVAARAEDEVAHEDYVATQKTIDDELKEANAERAKLEQELERRGQELEKKNNTLQNNMSLGGFAMISSNQATNAERKTDAEYQQHQAALDQIDKRIKTLEAAKNKTGFWGGVADALSDTSTYTFGLTDMRNAAVMHAVSKKIEKGQPLTEAEKRMLKNAANNNDIQAKYGDRISAMYRFGQISGYALPFVAEFVATGGGYGAVQAGIKGAAKSVAASAAKAAPKMLGNKAAQWMIRNTGVLAGDIAAGALMANTTGAAKTGADILKRHMGEVQSDGKGGYKFVGGKSLGRSIYEGEVAQTLEYYTEMLGAHFNIGSRLAKGAEKIGLSKMSKAINYLGSNKWLSKAGVQDYPSEVLEEESNIILNSLLVGDNKLSDLYDKKTQADIWGGMALSIGLMNVPKYAGTGYQSAQYYRYKHKTDTSDKLASYRLTPDKWTPIKEQIDGATNEEIKDVVYDIISNNDLHQQQKSAALDYVKNLVTMRGYNMALTNSVNDEVANEEKGEVPVDHSADKAYTDGYTAQDVTARKDVKMRHDELRGELSFATDEDFKILDDSPTVAKEAVMSRDDWSDEQKEQALAYVNAKEALAGVVDRINEDADYMAAQQREELKQKQHTDGALHPATLKEKDEEGHDKEVFIIDGHVQMTEDGSMVDAENSDKSVVVYNTATDKREIIDPTSDTGISTLGEVKTAEQQEAEIEDVRQRYVQTMMDEVQGTVRLAPGQQVVLQTGEDATVMATDGDNITVALGDGTQTNVSLADLQRISDEKAMEDYKQRHGIQYEQQPAEAQPVPQTIQEEPIPAQTEQPTETAAQEQAAVEPMPMKEDGEEDYYATTPERAHQYIFNEAELPRDVANGVVRAQYDDATKALAKAKAAPQPKVGKSIQQYKQAVAKRQEKIDEAQRAVDYWQRVREIQNDIYRQEAAERAATNAVAHDEAVAQAQADFEARKAAEVERKVVGNENPMPAITEKWNTATKIDGHKDEIMLPNGEPLKGHYVLHESGASSPSHNSENWAKTDGFPMDANDNSVNDRDYERDRDAQRHTEGIAQQYDQRALQNVPVVSNDGVVLSGNGRTIAGEIAARNNTDGAYVDYLKEYAHKFGFTPEQVEGMHHPRVSFVPDDAMPYTAETFARFNQQEMKSQNKTEQAVKLGKTVSDDSFGRIVRTINGYDTLGDFYNDPQASLGAVNDLHGAGVIPQAQMAEMVDGGRGNQRLSAVGREFLENMLIGKAFDGNPDVVRMLTEIPSMRQSVITALGEISDNIALGDGWALQNELADAVKLVYDARNDGDYQHGDIVSVYARQGRLFADPDELQTVADFNNMTMLMLADVLNDKRVTILKTTLALYNKDARDSANGVQDIFAGGVVSREEILRNVIKFINNAQRKELEAAHAAAVERRKTEGVQQDGTPPQVDEAERRVADDGGDTAAERGQSKSNTLSQENTEPRQIKLSDPRTMSDEEKQRRGEMLRDAYAIEVTVGQIVATEEVSARRAAEKWWDENVSEPAFYDTEAGEVEINRNSVESSLAHRYGQMKLDAITSLIDGFENAVYLGTMPDSRERGVVDHYFAYPIMYNGERCYVFCRAMQDANKNRLYVHEVFVAERIKKGDTLQTAASKPHGGISLYRDILANVLDASKEEVRSASEEQNEQSATDNTLRAEDKSDNPTTPNGNVSNSSAGKVTESSEELQGKEDKFTPAPIEDGEDYVDYAARVAAVKAQHDAIKAAEDATDTNPTEGQKKAGNYKKGHVQIGAFDISVEQPKGSVRRGKDADGKEWESKMNNTYGYFRGTEGVDGDHIDVFLSNDIDGWNGRKVFVVDQYNPDGTFDEHKVMLGFNDADDAKSNYLANYEKGWENGRRIDVSTTNLEDFEKWISSSHRKTKPFAEYKGVKIDDAQSASQQPSTGYSIEPTTYTNKKGKTTPMHLLKFDADLTKEQTRAINEFAKEKLSDGRFAKARGWRDRESGGWMFRSEEDAKKAAEMVNDAKAVEDAQPLSVEDMAEATDHAAVKAVDEAIKVEQEPQTTPQYDYDRENNVYDTVLAGLRETFNNRPAGSIPNIKAIEKEIRDLRKRAKTVESGMATATGETIPQAFDALARLNGRRKAYEQFLTDLRVKMAEVGRDKALAAHGLKLGDKIMYKGKEATIYDADQYQVTLDVGLAPIVYEAVDWKKLELPQHNNEQQDGRVPSVEHKADEVQEALPTKPKQTLQPKKVNVGSLFGELYKKGEAKLSDHTEEVEHESRQEESQEQPKQEEKKAKSKWVDDEDAERFEELRKRLKAKLRGQLNMGVDPEIFAAGVEMSYLMLKHGARKFAEFSKQMLEALGEEVRPYLKSFYNGARDLPEMEDYEKEMTPYDEVRDFDVKNFDKESAKDLVETAEHIVREQEVEQEAKEATKKLKKKRNEERKEDNKQSAANTDQKDVEASKEQVTKPTSTTDFIRNKGRFMSEADIEGALGKIFVDKETGSEIKVGKFVSPHDVAIKINGDASIILWPRLANTLNKENWQEVNNERVDAQEDTAKASGKEKKDISLQQQSTPDLFSGLSGEKDNLKLTSNEQEVHVQPRTSTSERKGGYQRGQNEPLGASQQHEDERTDTSRVAGRSGGNTKSDSAGGSRVSEPSDSKRNVKPAKPEPAPLAESERKNTHNNHAERGTDYAPKGTSARIEANIKAIETMQRLVGSGQPATPEDMAVLRKFSGWGGLGEAFSEMEGGPYGSINTNNKRLRELLSPEAYEDANMSRNSAYYTPAPVIDTLWDVARAMGFRGGNVLEGSAGIGNIIGLMPTDMSERSNIHAVEIDETTGNILSLLYPDANVEVKGFEKTFVPNSSVDLAITNVPFVTGLRVMDETGDKDLSRKFHDIHDFCIAKNVRKLKEGGVGIFITSSGTLDSPNSAKLRTWLVNEGGSDVVGAFRMHNQTFGGTGATSDIIVIRKRVNGRKSANAIDVSGTLPIRTVKYNTGETKRGSSEVIVKDLALDVNKHFVEHPEDMAGEMAFAFEKGNTYRATSKALYPSPSIDQEQRLSEWAQQFKDMDWDKAEERESQQVVYEDLGEDVKEGSMLLDSDGNLCLAQRGKAVPINVNANKVKGHTKAECFNAYKAIKDALTDVLEYQKTHSDDTGLKQKLDMLNKTYDAFVKTYGHLNKNTSISFLRSDIDFPSIAALESVSETSDKSGKRIVTYGKTDIFNRRVVETESEPKPTTIKDGIIASIYLNGRVDVPYIAEQLNMSDADVRQQIIESGLGFENPTTTEMEVSYEYLSGNVREKLYQAKENNTDGRYNENIKALERIIPMNIPAHLIEFTLGSSWIEPKLYEDFVKERTGLDVKLTNAGGTWVMSEPYWANTEKNKAMGVISEKCDKTILGHELIKAAITCKSINVTKTISTGYGSSKTTETIVDKEATMACTNKIDEIRQDFKDWARGKMQNDPEMSERIELVYNDLFNNSVPKEIPNEFVPKHFGGAASVVNGKPFQLRPHQAKAVIRATTQPLMLAHEVGTGKTYTLISTAMEMRRLGTARKPMIVVQNATVGQFVASAKALYPNAKVLTIEDADRNAEGRRNFYAKIRYNDWDMVVVPQSVFERIPDSEGRQIRFIEDKVEEKMMVLKKMREATKDDRDPVLRQVQRELDKLNDELNDHKLALSENKADGKVDIDKKREAKTKQNAMVKAQEMLDRETDDVANFDDMGIDALLIDEAHEYKHLGFATAMQRGVKGVDPSDSKKSQGVYLKTQAVLENKNGKNVIFATGTPISNTAAEIWTFMRYLMPADTMREYGIYYFDDFVRNFGNIQQMLEFATNGKYKENNRFAGYVNLPELVRIWACVADTVLTREAGDVSDKIPKMEGGKAQDIYLPQTKALRSVMKFVKDQLDDYEKMSGKEKKENSHIPLVMYGIAKAAAVDARLVLGDAADEPNSKTNEAVRQTLRSLEDTKEYNGTVAIFADNYQNKVSGFNLYEDIRKKLIDAGVPEAQVVVMKSGMKIKKKLEIFDKVNRGEVRVIMGSTYTLGTGVNIQERLHTLIHVDAPNRPMDYTQRNGRILRQGNMHNEWGIPVRVLRFGVEDSLDVTAYQRLKTKGAIADSIMEGKKMMSNSMEDRVLEEEQDLFGDITAQLSGSQYALLKNQVEKEVRKLEARQKQWEADQAYVHNQKPRLKALIKDSEERAERNKKSLAKVEAAKNDGITIGKMKFSSLDDMADYLKEYNSKQREQQEQVRMASGYNSEAKSDLTINVGGFDFHVKRVITKDQKKEKGQLSLSFFSKTKMTYSCPELGLEDVPVDGQRLKSALEDILENVLSGDDFREKAEYADRAAERYKGELQQVEARDGKPFEYADELKQAKKKLAEYEELMKAEMAVKDAKYAEMDASVETANSVTLSDEASEEDEDGATYRDYDDDESLNDATQENASMMRITVQQMSEKLHTPIKIVEDVESITHQNASVQERRRNSKGWYDVRTGEVVVVLPNNRDVEDVAATVMHETVAHKGLRELVGEEHYDNFLDEVYKHLRGDLKQGIDAEAGRAFVDDSTKNGERAKSYEQHRRTAVDELFGRLAEKPFEEFSEGERTLWQKLKEVVRKLLDKFLESLKLPKWFELGDNELRYMLWRSKERLERGKEHPIDLARDMVMREELGLSDAARMRMGDTPDTFKARQRRAVEEKGVVMPGLNEAEVKVVDVPRHSYKGSWFEAVGEAVHDAIEKYTRPSKDNDGKEIRIPIPQHYNNFGAEFDYGISRKSIEESINEEQIKKSLDGEASRGVHLAVLNHLDEVIGESIEFEEHPDYIKKERKRKPENGSNENILVHRFVGAIKVDGKEYRVKTTMLEYKQADMASREYAYDVTKIEVLDDTMSNTPNDLDRAAEGLLPLAKLLKDVEKSYDSGKKVLDESRKSDEDTAVYRIDNDDATPRANARAAYERMVSSAKNQFTEAVQDSMLSLKNLYKAILDAEGKSKSIEEVAAFENAYLAENRMASMSEAQIGVWHKDYMEPLIKEVSRLAPDKMAYEELTDYMMAKHGLERNEVLARRDAERAASEKYDARIAELDKVHQDAPLDQAITDTLDEAKRARQDFLNSETMANRERDYAGLTALTGKEEVADAEVEARRMVDDYEQAHETDALWKAVNAATRSSLYKIAESGMMSADRHRQVRDMFEYYIPLQGFDAKVAEDMYAYMGSDGTLGYGTPIRSAKGRKSKADDPIATIQMNGEAAIRQGNRNVMKQRFLNFVQAHPSDLVSVSDVWLRYNDVTGEWEQTYDADLKEDDRPEDVERKVRDFEERMEQLAKSAPDHYKRGGDLLNVPYRVLRSSNERQHQVLVQRGGKSYVLTINGSPRAAQALNGLTNPDIETEGIFGKAMNIGAKINRLLSSFYTTRNPEFVISNYIRDAFYSNSMMWVKEAPNYAMKFHKNFGKLNPAMMGKMFAEWESGSLREKVLQGGTGEIAYIRRMFYDFMMNGGETGWTNLRDIERHKRDLEKSLKLERSASRRAWKALGGCFDLMNRAVENNARFAAYMTSREMGRSVERSIWDAKEVSVNFNKKGAGDKFLTAKNQTLLGQIGAATGGLGRGLFLFWNASTQGLQNIGKQAKRHPAKFAGLATTLFVLGAVAPLIAEMLSGGDDDDKDSYYNLPEYVRRSNLVFRWSGGMPWITLPLPIEFRAIYGMGELATGMLTGKEHYSNEEFAKQFTSQMSQVLPLDFMEGGGGWHAFVPSSIKPFIEAQGNTSWTGLPIYRDNKFNPYAPQWKRAYDSANQQIVTATKWLNEVTGGDDATQGFIDWNPARIEYMLKGYLGGYFTMYDRLQKAAETAFGDRKFEWRNMPVASRVLKNGDERTAVRKLTNEYFNLLDEYKRTEARLKGYKKLVDEGGEDALKYAERIDYLHNSEEYRHYLLMDYYKPLIDTYYDMGKEAEGSERQRIKQEENALRREFVDLIHAVDEGKEIDLDATILQMLEDKARSGDVEVQKKAVSVAKNKYYERDGGKPTGFTQ